MKISCTNLMLKEGTLTEQALFLKEAGFDAISVFEELCGWNDRKYGELQDLKQNTGIEVCEFCFSDKAYGCLMDPDPAVRAEARAVYREAIAVCNSLGAVTEMEYEYRIQRKMPLFHPYRKMDEREAELFAETLAYLADFVTGEARLLIEPVNRYESRCLNTVADCAGLVRNCQKPRVGILADLFHMSIEEPDMEPVFAAHGDLILHVHLADNNRLLPGKGTLNWERILTAIARYGSNRYVNLECAVLGDQKQELAETVQLIRKYI